MIIIHQMDENLGIISYLSYFGVLVISGRNILIAYFLDYVSV